jgi:hypothetical protein
MKRAPATHIGIVAEICGATPADVRHACAVFSIPVIGGLLLRSPDDLDEDFPAEVRRIAAMNRTQAARQSAKAALNQAYPR